MSQQPEPGRPPAGGDKAESRLDEALRRRAERRRDRLRSEIHRSRTGDHLVPTWVMALALVLMLAAWAYLIVSA